MTAACFSDLSEGAITFNFEEEDAHWISQIRYRLQ